MKQNNHVINEMILCCTCFSVHFRAFRVFRGLKYLYLGVINDQKEKGY